MKGRMVIVGVLLKGWDVVVGVGLILEDRELLAERQPEVFWGWDW